MERRQKLCQPRKAWYRFATAALVFADPHLVLRQDSTDDDDEQRWHTLALAGGLEPLLLVVHVYREAIGGEEIIRIISARKASSSERRAYFE